MVTLINDSFVFGAQKKSFTYVVRVVMRQSKDLIKIKLMDSGFRGIVYIAFTRPFHGAADGTQ